ncbi:hypothetical protein AVEN_172661-1 [Araneus ventricosus]|uniref:Uncharacterized protein n=1 Tax=Araneus ventricosus TaxID=182803 RepID=A0A4Y2HKS5_ARAVE|nr:hypothetical protein AVEN_172661-1 [Araneus ventricosus]
MVLEQMVVVGRKIVTIGVMVKSLSETTAAVVVHAAPYEGQSCREATECQHDASHAFCSDSPSVQDRWNLSETGRRTFLFVPQININRASFNSRTNQFITGHGPFVTYPHRFGLCSHDRCVCGAKGDPNH